ncbi:MAG: hypothetical protein QOG63_2795 [Thermoleophilaceae bacterium]|jgi:dihydrodipicolinate synthase/N-acetylneuraminate lyase|nr:hypothetical protein [Thermoleophilaceae bacterium]
MAKKNDKQSAKKTGKKGAARDTGDVRIVGHPRARRQIALAKSYAGLGAFAFVAWSAYHGGAGFVDVAERALLWGIAAYILVWALGVHVWRHLAVAEVKAAEQRWRERKLEEEDQIRKLTAILEENGMPTTGTGAMPR